MEPCGTAADLEWEYVRALRALFACSQRPPISPDLAVEALRTCNNELYRLMAHCSDHGCKPMYVLQRSSQDVFGRRQQAKRAAF